MAKEGTSDFGRGRTVAGRSVRDLVNRRFKARVRFVLPMIGAVLIIAAIVLYTSKSLSKMGLVGAVLFLGLVVVGRILMALTDGRERKMIREGKRATRWAEGEEAIGAILDSLGDEYLVVHDVVSRYGNIDQLVIAKQGGLCLLETKAHGGKVSAVNGRVLVNGREPEKDFIAQTLNNTYWLRGRVREDTGLDIWVTPVLVFANAFVESTPPIRGIQIVNQKYLPRVLQQTDRRRDTAALWDARQKVVSLLSRASAESPPSILDHSGFRGLA